MGKHIQRQIDTEKFKSIARSGTKQQKTTTATIENLVRQPAFKEMRQRWKYNDAIILEKKKDEVNELVALPLIFSKRIPRLKSDIFRSYRAGTYRGDHDFCFSFSVSHYTDVGPTS